MPMNTAEYHAFASAAVVRLDATNDAMTHEFALASFERWDVDLNVGLITWSSAGIKRVCAKFVPVGTLSPISETWLWAWRNFHLPIRMRGGIKSVRRYGREHDIGELTLPKWPADEDDAWRVTAVSAHILGAQGACGYEMSQATMYGLLFDVTRVT